MKGENSELVVQAVFGTEGFYAKCGFVDFGLDKINLKDMVFPYRKMIKKI